MQLYGYFEGFPRIVWVGKIMTPVWQYAVFVILLNLTQAIFGVRNEKRKPPHNCVHACIALFTFYLGGDDPLQFFSHANGITIFFQLIQSLGIL